MTPPVLSPHQQRVVDEKAELDQRIEKLAVFINGQIFATVPQDERERLTRQLEVMRELSVILADRIAHF